MKPHAIWSLLDMLRFHASAYTAAISSLTTMNELLDSFVRDGPRGHMDENWLRNTMRGPIDLAKTAFENLPLTSAVRARIERLLRSVDDEPPREISNLVNEVKYDLVNDLDAHLFLVVKSCNRKYYDEAEGAFGPEVQDRFPEAGLDIAAASRCYALEEWTACVMHLMRVVEIGLKWMAKDVGLPPTAYQLENWKTIIDQIDTEIKRLEQQKKSQAKNERIKALSGAAVQFRYFKDAWRNHANHAHENYDDKAARRVWDAVEAFMQALADPKFPSGQQSP